MTTRTRKFILLALILMLGAAILAPIVMAFDPDRMPGDFIFSWGKQSYLIPVIWSLIQLAAPELPQPSPSNGVSL